MSENNMNLRHIKLEGFKSIARLDIAIEKINILIGANGAGKTNLISLFTFLRNLSEGKLKNYVEEEGGADRFFHFGSRNTKEIIIDLKININGYHVEFSPNYDDDTLVFKDEYCTIDTSYQKWRLSPSGGESGFVFPSSESSYYVKKYTREYMQNCRVYHFHDTSKNAKFKKTNNIDDYYFLEKDAGNIAPFLYFLKESDNLTYRQSYHQIVSAIQVVAPFFHDFYLRPTDRSILLRWLHKNHDVPFSANTLSDGTARFICLAVLFLQPVELRPDTIILDEPELGLHPAALQVLADIIHSVSNQTQVICSTQSVTFANLFSPQDFIVVDIKDGVSDFRRIEEQELKVWLDDYGMGDIWSKNLIGGRPNW